MYHRVADVKHDPWAICVSPDRFAQHMAALRATRTVMTMPELVSGLRAGNLPADAVAVTFDDGYRDNLLHAKPVLQAHSVPATVFAATGYVGQPFYWWDELASFCLQSPHAINYQQPLNESWVTFTWRHPEPDDLAGEWKGWEPPRTARQRAFAVSWKRLYESSSADRLTFMAALRERFPQPCDNLAAPMRAEDFKELVEGNLVQVEAHTVTHPALTALTARDRQQEMRQSADECGRLTGRPVRGLAYPHGKCNVEVCLDAEATGFAWACSTRYGFLDEASVDCYALPRITVTDVSVDRFKKLLIH